jgi:Mg/Co/Ni transporter MgtE
VAEAIRAAVSLGDTAAQAAVSDVLVAVPTARAAEVRAALAGREFGSATEIVLLEEVRFVGVVPIERLLASADQTPLGNLAEQPARVSPGDDLEAAARATARGGGRSVPVVDAEGGFRVVPPTRLLHVLELEHEEDLARLGGLYAEHRGTTDRRRVVRRLWHRLPWLGLASSSDGLGRRRGSVRGGDPHAGPAGVLPAGGRSMADAVGTQTETVVIRGWRWAFCGAPRESS